MVEIGVKSTDRAQIIDITAKVRDIVDRTPVEEGVCRVFVPHTTAGITVNEAYDHDVGADLLKQLDDMVPWIGGYRHTEGNSAAHIKASILGSTASIIIHEGQLALGTWQGLLFCEFDGPRQRQVWVQVSGSIVG
jgi:secondary thiamine-phosphate synthase enzyme